jgi:hypothetical protein
MKILMAKEIKQLANMTDKEQRIYLKKEAVKRGRYSALYSRDQISYP